MEIIRGRLSSNDYSPSSLRYNEGTDTVQYTPDGGETWIDDPADDPRVGTKFLKPLKTGSDIQCRSAASMVMWLRNFIEYEAGIMTAGAGVAAIGNGLMALLSPIAPYFILLTIVFDAAGSLFAIGATALNTAFDEGTWDNLLCILNCNIESDGGVTDADMTEIQAEITAQLNTTAGIVLNLILQIQGIVGLSNAGTLYEPEDPDCSDCFCGWCWDSSNATNLDEWTAGASGGGSYNSGLGQWEGTNVGSGSYGTIYAVDREWAFGASTVVSSVAVRFGCSYNDGGRPTIILTLAGTQVGRVDSGYSQGAVQTDVTFTADFADITCDKVRVYMASGTGCSVDDITMRGQGTNPIGTNNC